ncbi:hypothetical protein CSUI_000573 [Cystoisospora suis]|uniref:Uncharacterized protein n=1 Tax=Cystoisospora suis TaxID=483139 RepID=A0A2C6KNJ0_9APIC|nr:hypothetical protein CSUI_000573 [Cystoisospora suis]
MKLPRAQDGTPLPRALCLYSIGALAGMLLKLPVPAAVSRLSPLKDSPADGSRPQRFSLTPAGLSWIFSAPLLVTASVVLRGICELIHDRGLCGYSEAITIEVRSGTCDPLLSATAIFLPATSPTPLAPLSWRRLVSTNGRAQLSCRSQSPSPCTVLSPRLLPHLLGDLLLFSEVADTPRQDDPFCRSVPCAAENAPAFPMFSAWGTTSVGSKTLSLATDDTRSEGASAVLPHFSGSTELVSSASGSSFERECCPPALFLRISNLLLPPCSSSVTPASSRLLSKEILLLRYESLGLCLLLRPCSFIADTALPHLFGQPSSCRCLPGAAASSESHRTEGTALVGVLKLCSAVGEVLLAPLATNPLPPLF